MRSKTLLKLNLLILSLIFWSCDKENFFYQSVRLIINNQEIPAKGYSEIISPEKNNITMVIVFKNPVLKEEELSIRLGVLIPETVPGALLPVTSINTTFPGLHFTTSYAYMYNLIGGDVVTAQYKLDTTFNNYLDLTTVNSRKITGSCQLKFLLNSGFQPRDTIILTGISFDLKHR